MANLAETSNEGLLDALQTGYCGESGELVRLPAEAVRAELLRRLSAGNSQAEKVQITQAEIDRDEPSELRDDNATRYAKPERSDGRITEADYQAAMRDPVAVRLLEHYKAEVQQAGVVTKEVVEEVWPA